MTDGSATKAAELPSGIDLAREATFQLGGLGVSPAIREVAVGELRETLEPRVMQALVAMARRKGQVVSRDELIASCWDGRIVGDDAINGAVAKVRKLGEAHQAFTVQTIPRVGYRLTESRAGGRTMKALPWRAIAAAAILLTVLVGGVGFWVLRQPPPVRVAVLPFKPLSADPGAQAMAVRVADQIAGVLSVRQVDVASTGSAKNAQLIVSGTVESAGPMVQVCVRITDPRTQSVIWQALFDGESGPNSPAPDRAAAKVTDLVVAATSVLRSSKGQIKPAALKALVLGADSSRDGQVIEPMEFNRAARDGAPNLSGTHSAYAGAVLGASQGRTPEIARTLRAEAERETRRALELDPSNPTAYYVMAQIPSPFDFAARGKWLTEGLKHAPNDGSLNTGYGLLLIGAGRTTEGVPLIRRGLALDPLSPPKNFGTAGTLAGIGFMDEGRALLDHARRIWPKSSTELSMSLGFAVDFMEPDDGLELIAALERNHPEFTSEARLWRQYFAALKCGCGQADAAQAIVAQADHLPPRLAFPALSRLGQLDLAFQVAESGQSRFQSSSDVWLLFVRETAPMRRQARFMDLAAKFGLAQYWRATGRWPDYCAEPGLPYDCKVEAARAVAQLKKI